MPFRFLRIFVLFFYSLPEICAFIQLSSKHLNVYLIMFLSQKLGFIEVFCFFFLRFIFLREKLGWGGGEREAERVLSDSILSVEPHTGGSIS